MKSLDLLLADRDEVLRSVAGSTALHPFNVDLHAFLASALAAEGNRRSALAAANDERSVLVRAAIQRAADEYLTPGIRRLHAKRRWCGCLSNWLRTGSRFKRFGLARLPCRKSVRDALKNWIPPNGDAGKGG